MPLSNEDKKDILVEVINKIDDRITWLADRSPKSQALQLYIKDIEENEKLPSQMKAALIYNAKRDLKKCSNTYAVIEKAVPLMKQDAVLDRLDPDWLNLYMDKVGNVSVEEMQELWACILAQECNEPDSMSKALLQTMENIGRLEADLFMKLASFSLELEGKREVLITHKDINGYYAQHGLGVSSLHRLETLGLVNLDISALGGYSIRVEKDTVIRYFDKTIMAGECELDEGCQLSFGCVMLSFIGEALMRVVSPDRVEGYYDDIVLPYLKNPHGEIEAMFQ